MWDACCRAVLHVCGCTCVLQVVDASCWSTSGGCFIMYQSALSAMPRSSHITMSCCPQINPHTCTLPHPIYSTHTELKLQHYTQDVAGVPLLRLDFGSYRNIALLPISAPYCCRMGAAAGSAGGSLQHEPLGIMQVGWVGVNGCGACGGLLLSNTHLNLMAT